MTLSECYEEMGADLHEVLRRLKTEERIGKFLKLILTDTNYESLCKALEEKNYEQAFTHIHNLKGLAMNLEVWDGNGKEKVQKNHAEAQW